MITESITNLNNLVNTRSYIESIMLIKNCIAVNVATSLKSKMFSSTEEFLEWIDEMDLEND